MPLKSGVHFSGQKRREKSANTAKKISPTNTYHRIHRNLRNIQNNWRRPVSQVSRFGKVCSECRTGILQSFEIIHLHHTNPITQDEVVISSPNFPGKKLLILSRCHVFLYKLFSIQIRAYLVLFMWREIRSTLGVKTARNSRETWLRCGSFV